MNQRQHLQSPKNITFVNPWIKYSIFFFSFLCWVFSLLMIAVGIFAKSQKATDTMQTSINIDPAFLLVGAGIITFFVTFCGCVGALRENVSFLNCFCLSLAFILILLLLAGVLGFVYSEKAEGSVNEFVRTAVSNYRSDIDLQNLIDYIQEKFQCCGWYSFIDWSQNLYFNCTVENHSREKCGVPFSCCIHAPGETVINTMCGYDVQSLSTREAANTIYTTGCEARVADWTEHNFTLIGGIAFGLIIPQILGYLLTRKLISQIKLEIENSP
ncbi:tetraspanin-33-like isoform X1 [Rhinatrema bivittatum]|uniref:tetraspanin-33-like isoform X1 n=1 Tax=Rhinatrema bivittatum TaxID=194408 RepID=UPI00112AA819|nr:tetraspanin-33-like isoform X1 [Rhinatrema bivittatum]